jgi:hypothetical protein
VDLPEAAVAVVVAAAGSDRPSGVFRISPRGMNTSDNEFANLQIMSRQRHAAKFLGRVILGALLALFTGPTLPADTMLPIFDTHVHYNRDDWASFSPQAVIALLQHAGVTRALVSSTPDDGTLMLYRQDTKRIIPVLRPYRTPADRVDWFGSAEVLAYVEQRLARRIYRGIGEFHLTDVNNAATAQMARLIQDAVNHELVLHVHSDAEAIRELFTIDTQVRILWAHAGMSAPPSLVGELLDSHPGLWTEVSLRAGDIAPNGRLDAEWRALFLRHPERFMVGTDTWATFVWPDYVEVVREHRGWLSQLPKDVAAKIAYDNAARLFIR